MQLASRLAPHSPMLRSELPLSDDQIRAVLQELRGEGFQPFMACQTRVRHDNRREFIKHLIWLRHASQINGREANEIILLNSHDGTNSYQMLAGVVRLLPDQHRRNYVPPITESPTTAASDQDIVRGSAIMSSLTSTKIDRRRFNDFACA